MYFHPSAVLARHYRIRGFLRLEGLAQALGAEDLRARWEVTLKLNINGRNEHPDRYPQTLEEPRTTTPFADSLAYLRQEARVLGAFQGERAAQLVEQLEDAQLGVVLVVQRRAGALFLERLRRGVRPSFAEVHALMIEAWLALGELHAAGAVHGGLCPASFLVDARPDGRERVSLVDLGYAHLVAEPEAAVVGNPLAYRDLEQALLVCGRPAPAPDDARVDVYACARAAADLLGYDQLVTLDALPLGSGGQPVQHRLADLAWRGREHLRNALGAPVEAWFRRALALDSARRFVDAAEALDAWRALVGPGS